MSWRAYPVLSVQPDFNTAPFLGIVDSGRTMVDFGQATAWASWPGDTPLAFSFTWRLSSPAELRTFREFMAAIGGKASPFFLPSWLPDFELAAPVAIGDLSIRVKAAGFSDIVEDRPDTPGRQLFLVSTANEFQPIAVIGAELDGDEEVLSVDFPIGYNFTAAGTMVGMMHLVRLAEDSIEYTFELPGCCTVPLRAVTSRQTRHLNDQQNLESEALFDLHRFDDVIATDENPLLSRFDTSNIVGPENYGIPQADNFYREWSGTVEGTVVTIRSPGKPDITSTLYDSSFQTKHLALGFDVGGREALAWETEYGTIRLRWQTGGGEHALNLPGISPLFYNTFAIDSTVSAGDADLILFYVRDGYSGIFARFYREDFATEHLVARSPTPPIYLQMARRLEGRIELVGMDAGHRLGRWRTTTYLTPPEKQILMGGLFETLPGLYRAVTIFGAFSEGTRGGIDPSGLIGEYRSIVVHLDVLGENFAAGSIGTTITGSYVNLRIFCDAYDEELSAGLVNTLPGEYKLVAKTGPASEGSTGGIETTISGTYGP